MIDLRSDTVTEPTAAMRRAMANADVGDDVFGEDPTVVRLERTVAERLGKEAALFVPSGTMANQIALLVHCRPGDSALVSHGAHMFFYEAGGAGAIAGVQLLAIGDEAGFDGADVRAAAMPDNHLQPPTSLVVVENTHNRAGGRVVKPDTMARIADAAASCDLPLHVDGARLPNACVALGVEAHELVEHAASVSICLSKALGAPVGSLLAGSDAFIDRAHRFRKMLGGGMRQVGVLAAAGLVAIEDQWDGLRRDHDHALEFARSVDELPGLSVAIEHVETNIVMIQTERPNAPQWQDALGERKVAVLALGPSLLRAVFHHEIDDSALQGAIAAFQQVATGPMAR